MPDWFLILTLLLIGFILLLIEVVTPGFTIPGTLGLSSLFAANYFAFTALDPLSSFLTSAGSIIGFIFFLKFFVKSKTYKKLHLDSREKGIKIIKEGLTLLKGKEGITLTPLRPSGVVLIQGKKVQVMTEGDFLPPDTAVKVIRTEGMRIFVRKKED